MRGTYFFTLYNIVKIEGMGLIFNVREGKNEW